MHWGAETWSLFLSSAKSRRATARLYFIRYNFFMSKTLLHLLPCLWLIACAIQPAPATPPVATATVRVANTLNAPPSPTVVPPVSTTLPTATTPAYSGLTFDSNCAGDSEFKSIAALDEHTVRFTLCAPDVALPAKLAFPAFVIHDQADLTAPDDLPNGTGPYQFAEWSPSAYLRLAPNPNYWNGQPAPERLIFRWSREAQQRLFELQHDTVDGIDNPMPEAYGTVISDARLRLMTRPALTLAYLGFNNRQPPLEQVKVRHALALALDRARLLHNFYPASATLAPQFAPDGLPLGPTPGLAWVDHDLAQARQLLTEAGLAYGFELTLLYRDEPQAYAPYPALIAQDIQAQLAAVKINVTLRALPSAEFFAALEAGEAGAFLLGWGADYADPTNFYNPHFIDYAARLGRPYAEIEAALRAAAEVADPAARQAQYDLVNQLIKDSVPLIPLAQRGSATAWHNAITGVPMNPLGIESFAKLGGQAQIIWMQNAEPQSLACLNVTEAETLRACAQLYEPLVAYAPDSAQVAPGLATRWEANAALTEWTFTLRSEVTFHNGARLEANDVVATFKYYVGSPTSYFEGYFGGG